MISVRNLTLKFPTKTLFEDVTIDFKDNNCYGIIGANGAGKTTFLKILSGEIDSTSGDVVLEKGARMSVLAQNHYAYEHKKVIDVVLMGNKRLYEIMEEKDKLYSKPDFNDADGIRVGDLEDEFLKLDGWSAEYKASTMLRELNINEEDFEKELHELKNQDKVKVLLAKTLFDNPDVLIMDEPTNNLDLKTIKWLEEFIINYEKCVIVVSHDRHFLNNVCTHTVDIDYSKMTIFTGNYDFWYETSELIMKQRNRENKKKEERITELQDFIRRFSANASKSKQATARKKMLDKIDLDTIQPSSRKHPHVEFKYDRRLGSDIITLNDVSYKKDNIEVLKNVNLSINNDDKVFFFGNSVRTTLLLEIISGVIKPDSGTVTYGSSVIFEYFKQDNSEEFGRDITLLDYLKEDYEKIDDTELRSYLGRMLFTKDEALKKVNVLSGGEKVRLKLAKMMIRNANVLILDEPTNHLDLESITALNKALINFDGVIIFTSQDYEFINTLSNKLIELEDNGTLKLQGYNYEEYVEKASK